MNYAVKYRLSAYSAKYKDVYQVDIFEDDYTGPILLKNMGAGKIVLSKSDGIIQKTTLEISIQSDNNFEFVGFMQYDNRKYLVQLRKNGDIIWQGYQVAESYSEPYQNPPYDVSIIATDNLGFLENYTFNNEELPGRLATAARLSHFEAIDACINNTNLALYYDIAIDFYEQTMDTNESMLHQLKFKADIFNGENCKDVVEALLPYGAILTQHNNRWLIRRPLDDTEKTHIIYTFSGDRFGTTSGESLLTLSDYVSGGVWPHGTPILELEHAWKDALLIKEYGKKQSFLQNYNFADGAEKWTGSYSVKKVDNVYYAQIKGYTAPGSNVSVSQSINVISTVSDFIFECQFDVLGGRNSTTTSVILADKSIEVTAKIQVQIGGYYLTPEGWSTTAQAIELLISSSPSRKPNWKSLRVVADNIPTTGELTVRFFQVESESLSNKWISGICFTDVKVYTEELNEAPNPQVYKVDILENAAGGRNEIKLKPTDLPGIANAELFYTNGSTIGVDYYSSLWSHNGGTAKNIQSAIAEQLATYYQSPRHRISGCDWRGVGLSLNAIALHPKNARRKFIVEKGSWNILEDTFNVTWVETAGTGTASAVEYSGETPASEAAGTGSSNLSASHPPVTIHEDSEDYLEIADDQILKFTPEDYHWFIHSPQQILGLVNPPENFQVNVDGSGAVQTSYPSGYFQVTAVNENGETLPGIVPAFDVLNDSTQAVVSWNSIEEASVYNVYVSGGTYAEIITNSFDALTLNDTLSGNPPTEDSTGYQQAPFKIEKEDWVQFVGENIEIETTATGTTKTVTFTGHPPVSIATGSASYLSINGEQELSLDVTGINTDETVKFDADDTSAGYLSAKIIAGTNITIEEGTGTDENKLKINSTASGADGEDGITPHIGANGNWWIGEADTGVKAEGTDGEPGDDGAQGAQGAQGVQGEKGEQGDQGAQGTQGFQGVPGEQGNQGDQGADGTGVTIVGSKPDSSSLPPSYGGNIGDGYITQNDGHLWIWNGSGWDDVGLIRGPQGERGFQGFQGFQGEKGYQGSTGAQGVRGYQGFQGEKGSQGNQGNQGVRGYQGYQGAQGKTGDSHWIADTYGIHYDAGNVGIGTDADLTKGLYVYTDKQYGVHIENTRTISSTFALNVGVGSTNPNSYILYLYSDIGEVFNARAGGSIYFNQYGRNNYTGTAAKYLAVTSFGKVIEVDAPASSKWTEENNIIRSTSGNDISMLNNRYLGFNVYWDSDWKHLSTGYAAWIKQESDGNFQINLSGTSRAAGNIVQSTKYIKFQNTTGNIIANNFVLASLRKLKKWIKNIVNLEKFDKIKIQQFVFKSDETERIRYGVIADDVEKIAPELVYSDDKGNKEVAYIDLAMAKIARLEERIKKLENGS